MQTGKLTPALIIFTLLIIFTVTLKNAAAYDTIQKPYTFLPGAPAKASEVNQNFDVLYEKLNALSAEVQELKASTFNCIAVNTLKNAYIKAQGIFIDNPSATINVTMLLREGLVLSDGVILTIENGTIATLSMSAKHINTGKIYSIDKNGFITPEDDFSSLATAYINLLSDRWEKTYNSAAYNDIKNAYTATQAYFIDHPTASITLVGLQEAGYQASENVTVTIKRAKMENLVLTASHTFGDKLYIVDWDGSIISEYSDVGDKIINDLLNSYTAAQAFFTDFPNAVITYIILLENGYQPSEGVTLTVTGSKSSLLIEATHIRSYNNCKINHAGVVSVN